MSQEHAIPDTQNTLQKFPLACELSYGPSRAAINRMEATKRIVAIWGSQSVTVGFLLFLVDNYEARYRNLPSGDSTGSWFKCHQCNSGHLESEWKQQTEWGTPGMKMDTWNQNGSRK